MSIQEIIRERLTQKENPARPVLKSGERAERLTFIGITGNGTALCQCDCGAFEEFSPALLAAFVRPLTRYRQKRLPLMRCEGCRKLAATLCA